MPLTPEDLHAELQQLRLTAETISEGISDVSASIRYFTDHLMMSSDNEQVIHALQEISAGLYYLTMTAKAQVDDGVDKVADLATASVPRPDTQEASETAQDEQCSSQSSDARSQNTEAVPLVSDSRESQGRGMDSLDSPHRPFTFRDWQDTYQQIKEGNITASELKTSFQALLDSKEAIISEMVAGHNAKQLKDMVARWCKRPHSRKADNAASIYQSMLHSFAPGKTISHRPFDGETFEQAVEKQVSTITDEYLASHAAEIQARRQEREKAFTDPETYDQWEIYVKAQGGYAELTTEQQATFDRIKADRSRRHLAERQVKQVERLAFNEDIEFSLKEGYHDKKQCPLWIVQLSSRVERSTYLELKVKAKELGGWFSSFKKADTGFQFYDETAARAFMRLSDESIDNQEIIEARKIRSMSKASDRLSVVAQNLAEKADAALENDETRLKNTHRRASMAAGMRSDAYRDLATAKTLQSLAQQLESGEIQYLDGINAATQLAVISKRLHRGKHRRIQSILNNEEHGGPFGRHRRREELESAPFCEQDVAFAEYPYPNVHRSQLASAIADTIEVPGMIQVARRLNRIVASHKTLDIVPFRSQSSIDVLSDFIKRCRDADRVHWMIDSCLDDYNRLQAANIHTIHELRAAIRELLPHVQQQQADDLVTKAEDALRGSKLPGFFPTPKTIIYKMLEEADIEDGHRVLEPSAGKGDIMDLVRNEHPAADITGIEQNHALQEILRAKGYGDSVEFGDFLGHQGEYDRILMNPPFENRADIQHVRHAFDLLTDKGRVVAIISKGPFTCSDKASTEFRGWLESKDHTVIDLPDGTFQSVEAFRQTGVRSVMVVIENRESA